MLVPSADGREVYEFNVGGRHLRTLDVSPARRWWCSTNDSTGLLIAVRDSLDNVTEIERNGSGEPTAIVAPFGQRTELSLDANGYLDEVEDPAGNRVQLAYDSTGRRGADVGQGGRGFGPHGHARARLRAERAESPLERRPTR
jgi:YD repeat-containing protein